MKQSLSSRLIALFCAVAISSVLLESVAELGHPAPEANVSQAVASATSDTSTPPKSQPL